MIVGKDSNIFTLADEVNLVLEPMIESPVQIESNRKFVIQPANGDIISGNSKESGIDTEGATAWHKRLNGAQYYVYGKGDLLVYKDAETQGLNCPANMIGSVYKVCSVDASDEVLLFNGSELTDFKGLRTGTTKMQLALRHVSGGAFTELASFDVTVLDAKFATSGSSVKRMIEAITVNPVNTTNAFARFVKTDNTATTANPNNSFPFGTNTVNTATPINANIAKTCPSGVVTDLTPYIHNGNPNVYACKDGNLQIGTINMTGVKTVLVENGNIVFTQNTKHANANDSWAFIVKDGNIEVKKDVTALEGVLMAIKTTKAGELISENSPKILRIDGMVYGNAKKMFENRTYVRGTNAYDTLTTGTIINYSNRSLRNVPPLLSQYLNAYNVQRVVR